MALVKQNFTRSDVVALWGHLLVDPETRCQCIVAPELNMLPDSDVWVAMVVWESGFRDPLTQAEYEDLEDYGPASMTIEEFLRSE